VVIAPLPSDSESVVVDLPASLAPGVYPLRIQVDGAVSPLREDTSPGSPGFAPAIEVTGGPP
jgi:hypothetical protein